GCGRREAVANYATTRVHSARGPARGRADQRMKLSSDLLSRRLRSRLCRELERMLAVDAEFHPASSIPRPHSGGVRERNPRFGASALRASEEVACDRRAETRIYQWLLPRFRRRGDGLEPRTHSEPKPRVPGSRSGEPTHRG